MKRVLIGTLVGAIIVFVFQAMSWMVLPIHKNSMKYTPAQDSVLKALTTHLHEDGLYGIPTARPDASQADMEKDMNARIGKPWAMINYHQSFDMGMGLQMGLGFLINLFSVLIVAMLMNNMLTTMLSFGKRLGFVMFFSIFTILQAQLTGMNWWHTPFHWAIGEILDLLIAWFLCGLWLAWYMGRGLKTVTP